MLQVPPYQHGFTAPGNIFQYISTIQTPQDAKRYCTYFDFDVMLVHFCGLESEGREDIRFSDLFSFFKIPKDSDRLNLG